MTASIHTPDFRQHRPNRVLHMHGASVIAFPKEGKVTDLTYMDAWSLVSCQAALLVASSLALYLKACDVSLGFHARNNGRGTCPTLRTQPHKSLAENGEGT